MIRDQFALDLSDELIIDNFAGGGGASCGIELGLGRHVDIAINHNAEAISMHEANHPQTEHLCESVWDVDPVKATKGRKVGLAWFSPDCKHFSKAKGGKPRDKKIRGLAWVVLNWVVKLGPNKPRVIILENVEEFQTWCPCLDDGQPSKWRKGWTFQCFIGALRRRGYDVEWRELRACDYGAPTIRKRLFLIARCDGKPIVWPEPSHAAPGSAGAKAGLKAWRTAAECIDWAIPCPSIFERKKPLADATCRRIAKGIMRYVVNSANPFVVHVTHQGDSRVGNPNEPMPTVTGANRGELAVVSPTLVVNTTGHAASAIEDPLKTVATGGHHMLVAPVLTEHANQKHDRVFDPQAPLRTQCAEVKGGHFALAAATLVQTGYGERDGQAPRAPGLDKPLGTAVAGGVKHAAVTAFLAKHYGGVVGIPVTDPTGTITGTDHHSVVAAHITKFRANSVGSGIDEPLHTIVAGGGTPERPGTGGAMGVVSASLVGCGGRAGQSRPRGAAEPLQTITAKADTAIAAANLVRQFGRSNGAAVDAAVGTVMADGGGKTQLVKSFLIKYYGNEKDALELEEPMHTVTSRDRFGLVTVKGILYAIADIGLRMLAPRELFRAQGFPDSYAIGDDPSRGFTLTKSAQVRMVGNSVCPPLACALVTANVPEMSAWSGEELKRRRSA